MPENEKHGKDDWRRGAGPRSSNDQLGENAGEGRVMQSQSQSQSQGQSKGKQEKKRS